MKSTVCNDVLKRFNDTWTRVTRAGWSWDRESGLGKFAVRSRRVPTSADSGRAVDAAHGSPRLLSALAADDRRQVLPLQ